MLRRGGQQNKVEIASAWNHLRRSFGYASKGSVRRRPEFGSITDTDIAYFRSFLGGNGVITDPEALDTYNKDWLGHYKGRSRVAVRPTSTDHVAQILAHCHANNLAVVPQGGNTGLVGGSVPVHDELVLSLSRMNKILGFDGMTSAITCEAGCILQDLEQYLEPLGAQMPLDLGAKGSCQIGGNIATNAGGVRFIRHGSLRGNVLGLEVVLADGTVVDTMSTLRKDNTGYDLKQLFLGSEGTLGVITQVSLIAPKRSSAVNLAFLACRSFEDCCSVYQCARGMLGEILSAVEFMDDSCLSTVIDNLDHLKHPFGPSGRGKGAFYVLIETSGSNNCHDREKLDTYFDRLMEDRLIEDGIVAQDRTQARDIWEVREMQAVGLVAHATPHGKCFKYDISVPIQEMYDLVVDTQHQFSDMPHVMVNGFGHLGDGNLHLNVVSKEDDSDMLQRLEPFIYDRIAESGGSVSAEHGLGQMKAEDIYYSKSPSAVSMMQTIKQAIDPKGILNPYKVLPVTPS